MLPHIVTVLGPDRVGKSTLIDRIQQCAIASGKFNFVEKLHFSGPKPYHNDPIQQYIHPFNECLKRIEQSKNDIFDNLILCDRGFSEVCFYENFRRNIDISDEWAMSAESYFEKNCIDIEVFLIMRDWNWCKPHHEQEILQEYSNGGISLWHMNNLLEVRKKEHYAYYDYMNNYLLNKSLLKNKVRFISASDLDNIPAFIDRTRIPHIGLKA